MAVLRRIPAQAMAIDQSAADDHFSALAASIGSDSHMSAKGVVGSYVEQLAGALCRMAVERSLDPGRLALVASGGAGPLFATEIAECMGIDTVIIPPNAGALSALGCANARASKQFTSAIYRPLDAAVNGILNDTCADLRTRGEAWIASQGGGDISFRAEVRFPGGHFRTSLPCSPGKDMSHDIAARAEQAYRSRAGTPPPRPAEIATLSAIVEEDLPRRDQDVLKTAGPDPRAALLNETQVWQGSGFATASVYDATKLSPGNEITGPAMIVQRDTTVHIQTGWVAKTDDYLNTVMTQHARA